MYVFMCVCMLGFVYVYNHALLVYTYACVVYGANHNVLCTGRHFILGGYAYS